MRRTVGVMLLLAVMLIAAPLGVSAFSNWASTSQVWPKVENRLINDVFAGIRDSCTETLGHICEAILMHPQAFGIELRAVRSTIERRKAKAVLELPTVNIYMSDGVWHELSERRKIAFSKGGAWAVDGLKDWFNGEMATDKSQKIVKVRFRLKGKDPIHVKDPKKMSLRVKVKNGDQLLGMSEFSIHDPMVRLGQIGAIAQDTMKQFGVLATGTIFAHLRINNELVGIMGLEESFSKEMLEAQGRRDSVIVAMDDDWVYRQYVLNNERGRDYSALSAALSTTFEWDKSSGEDFMVPLAVRDYPVQAFNARPLSADAIDRQDTVDGISIFRDMIDGRLPGSVVYDYNQLARFWMIAHMFSAQHGMLFMQNRRHYFNPITRRLEPVSHDLDPRPRNPCLSNNDWMSYGRAEYPCVVSDPAVRSIWDDPRFRTIFWEEASAMQKTMSSPKFKEWFASTSYTYEQIFSSDTTSATALFCPSCEKPSREWQEPESLAADLRGELLRTQLEKNLSDFLLRVREKNLVRDETAASLNIEQQKQTVDDVVTPENQEVMRYVDPIYTHIRPFYERSEHNVVIQLKNLSLDPIFVHSVFSKRSSGSSLLPIKVKIPAYIGGHTEHIFQTEIPTSKLALNESLWIKYAHKSKIYTRPMISQERDYQTGYASSQDTAVWFKTNRVHVNEKTKTIALGPGHYSLKFSIQTRPGWQVEFRPGAVLEFKHGARLRVNGPVHLLGSKDAPVQLLIQPDFSHSKRSWGGLLVVNAATQSRMRHVLVTGSARMESTRRQDANGLTGCITFYKSNLSINHARFSGLHCEDALNIVHSTFDFDDLEISDSEADAFDSDFSNGKITHSKFSNNKNDDIDLSGSEVELQNSDFLNSGDKAISVGEGSILEAVDIKITGATAGIVSKDQSVANVRNASITNVNTGLMAYIKKSEWGPPTLNCQSCSFKNVESIAAKQSSSAIRVGNVEVGTVPFSRKQLRIAGYLQSNL